MGFQRCNFFNNNGDVRDPNQPCKQGSSCRFVHPDDSGWSTARRSNPPHYWKLPRTPEPETYMSSDRESYPYRRSPSPSYRSRESFRGRSRSRRRRSRSQGRSSFDKPPSYADSPRRTSGAAHTTFQDEKLGTSHSLARKDSDVSMGSGRKTSTGSFKRDQSMDRRSRTPSNLPITGTSSRPVPTDLQGRSATPSQPTAPNSKTKLTPQPPSNPSTAAPSPASARKLPPQPSSNPPLTPPPPFSAPAVLSALVPTTFLASSSKSMLPPPVETAKSGFTLPAPPKPPPSLFDASQASSKPEPPVDAEKMKKIWHDRMELFSNFSEKKKSYNNYDEQIRHAQAIFKSPHYKGSLTPAQRKKLEGLENKSLTAKGGMEKAIEQLRDSNSWPMGAKSLEGEVAKKDNDIKELIKLTQELTTALGEVDRLAKELGEEKEQEPKIGVDKGKGKAKEITPDEDNMEVDEETAAGTSSSSVSRPRKRRRMSSSTLVPVHPQAEPSMDDIEQMQKTFMELESRFSYVENLIDYQSHDFERGFQSLLDPKSTDYLEELPEGSAAAEQREMLAEIDELKSDTRRISALMEKMDIIDRKASSLAEQNKNRREEVGELQKRLEQLEKKREEDQSKLAAAERALKLYQDNPPSPPASPAPSELQDDLLVQFEAPIHRMVMQGVEAKASEIRTTLQGILRDKDKEIYNTVWENLTLTQRLIQVVASRVQVEPQQPQAMYQH